MEPMHPEVIVRLTGETTHPLFIVGRSVAAMRRAGLREVDRQAFLEEATAGDYDDLLSTIRRWFRVE